MAELCIVCNQLVQDDDAWLVGWSSDGSSEWQHTSCAPTEPMETSEVNSSLDQQPSSPPSVPSLEASLEDSLPVVEENPPPAGLAEVTYQVISESTIFRGEKLFDSLGYSYNVKRRRGTTVDWQCTVRPNNNNRCPATVCQKPGGVFNARNAHNHQPAVGSAMSAKVCARVKKEAVSNLFRPATAIVQEVLTEEITTKPIDSLPTLENIARAANRVRQKLRPKDPTDLNFELETGYLPPDFLRDDIRVKDRRHIVFARDQQLRHLSAASTWYIDGTFKLCRHPFTQLFTINIFGQHGDCAKQVPMVFVLMSGRNALDYKKVLQSISAALPQSPVVKTIVADYEKAAWKSCRKVFPQATLRGCVFHFTQAVWRKVQALGLQIPYQNDERMYGYIHKLMALPFLPADRIRSNFRRLKRGATTEALKELIVYFETNWIESTVWPKSNWSVYKESVRTNNDIEGWHNALNRRAGGKTQLPFYLLIQLLGQEAKLVDLQIRLVNAEKLRRIQRRKYCLLQSKIFSLWESYETGDKTFKQLLKSVSKLYGPRAG